MTRFVRFSALGLAIAYIAVSIGVLGVLTVPVWYGWRENIEAVRSDLIEEDAETMIHIVKAQGTAALIAVVNARVESLRLGNLAIAVLDPARRRVAGNITAVPPE